MQLGKISIASHMQLEKSFLSSIATMVQLKFHNYNPRATGKVLIESLKLMYN
jgi:hypothetical protein